MRLIIRVYFCTLPDPEKIQAFIARTFLLAKPLLKIADTTINLKIVDYAEDVKMKAFEFKTNADELLKYKVKQHSHALRDIMESRKGDEIPLVIFALDLKCHSGSGKMGAAYK